MQSCPGSRVRLLILGAHDLEALAGGREKKATKSPKLFCSVVGGGGGGGGLEKRSCPPIQVVGAREGAKGLGQMPGREGWDSN